MNIGRIDHIHINVENLEQSMLEYEKVFGKIFPRINDFTQRAGFKFAFSPYPKGIELLKATDTSKPMAKLYAEAPKGVFAISLKIDSLEEGKAYMEQCGYAHLFDCGGGEIKEALFDTIEKLGVYIELVEYSGEEISAAKFEK